MLAVLDASAIRRWCHAAADVLAAHRNEINDLNVYPIADGDAGTNLALTLRSAAEAISGDRTAAAGTVLAAMSQGAVFGAQGNSGGILSQILCGLSDGFDGAVEADAAVVVEALAAASAAAYAAVPEPVEGTMLSVIRAAAEAVAGTGTGSLAEVVSAAAGAAAEALRRTPEQLDVLARAGVVDAGGHGLVLVLNELLAVVTGERAQPQPHHRVPRNRAALEIARESGSSEFGYEVQFLLHAPDTAVTLLKSTLAELGDSLLVVSTGNGLFNVHVHVNDVGAAIEAGIEAGRPHRITVVRFADQIAAEPGPDARAGTGIVAIAPGQGLAELFRSEGVAVVEADPAEVTAEAVLAQILQLAAAQVIVLPNSAAHVGVAELAAEQAREQGIVVAVVPTKSPVQALAAVAVHDDQRRFSDDVIAVAEAAAATRFAEVTIAEGESITYAGRCEAGDVLGLIDGEVVEIGSDVTGMGISLVSRLVAAGGELVTVLSGADPGAVKNAAEVADHLRRRHPLVEVSELAGGQPHCPLLIGVE